MHWIVSNRTENNTLYNACQALSRVGSYLYFFLYCPTGCNRIWFTFFAAEAFSCSVCCPPPWSLSVRLFSSTQILAYTGLFDYVVPGLENLLYERRLKKLGFFQPGKKVRRGLHHSLPYLEGGYKVVEGSVFTRSHQRGQWGKGTSCTRMKVSFWYQEESFIGRMINHWNSLMGI